MSGRAVVEVQGVAQLARALTDLADQLDELKSAHQQAANLVLGKALAATPRKTGRLAGSYRIGKSASASLVREGSAAVPYAGPTEFGGWPKGRPFVKTGRYLFPAAAESVEAVTVIYEAAVTKVADQF